MQKHCMLPSLFMAFLLILSACSDTSSGSDTPPTQKENQAPKSLISQLGSDNVQVDELFSLSANNSSDSDGNITQYQWLVEGKNIGQDSELLTHSFSEAGEKNITLIVTDNEGASSQSSINITVLTNDGNSAAESELAAENNMAPTAEITGNTVNIRLGQSLSFSALNSSDKDGTIVSYQWLFDENEVCKKISCEFTPSDTGTFELSLNVTDDYGDSHQQTKIITVMSEEEIIKPTAIIAIAKQELFINESILFTAYDSIAGEGMIKQYLWLIDGISYEQDSVKHIFEQPGNYEVALSITNDIGDSHSVTQVIEVIENFPPQAELNFNTTQFIHQGERLEFDASASYDPNGHELSYSWSNNGEKLDNNTAILKLSFDSLGAKDICLTLRDPKQLESSQCLKVIVTEVPTSTVLYYKGPDNYNHIYYWEVEPVIEPSPWPGKNMSELGNGWYKYDFGLFIDYAQVIFSIGSSSKQTLSLDFDPETPCYLDNVWVTMDTCLREDFMAPSLTAKPAAGNFKELTLEVSLISNDQDPELTTYYTLDGSIPNEQSSVYKGPITITDQVSGQVDATIKAYAIDSKGNQSEILTFEYKLNEDDTAQ